MKDERIPLRKRRTFFPRRMYNLFPLGEDERILLEGRRTYLVLGKWNVFLLVEVKRKGRSLWILRYTRCLCACLQYFLFIQKTLAKI